MQTVLGVYERVWVSTIKRKIPDETILKVRP